MSDRTERALLAIWAIILLFVAAYFLNNIITRKQLDQTGEVYRAEIARLEEELRECQAEPKVYIYTDERVEALKESLGYAKRVIVLLLEEYEVTNEQFENILKKHPDIYEWAQEAEE